MSSYSDDKQVNNVPPPRPATPTVHLGYEPPRLPWWQDMFAVPSGPASEKEVTDWWGERRWTYNVIVLCSGLLSFLLYLFFLLNSEVLKGGEDAVEPFAVLLAPVLVPLTINICYTLGLVAELLWRAVSGRKTREAGRVFMAVGVGFSLLVVSLPTKFWGAVWLWHVLLQ